MQFTYIAEPAPLKEIVVFRGDLLRYKSSDHVYLVIEDQNADWYMLNVETHCFVSLTNRTLDPTYWEKVEQAEPLKVRSKR